jgi:hypothetical protein
LSQPKINQILTKLVYFETGHRGERTPVLQTGRNRRHATMALNPEELVTLTNGTRKLHAAVSRVMALPLKERKRATIVREGEPATLNFEQIK